jgi:hypothetical protein
MWTFLTVFLVLPAVDGHPSAPQRTPWVDLPASEAKDI